MVIMTYALEGDTAQFKIGTLAQTQTLTSMRNADRGTEVIVLRVTF